LHFIKLNKFRGNIETFGVDNAEEAEVMLNQAGFGPYSDMVEFVVQKACEGVEIGIDVFFNGEDFVRPYFYTIEVKGAGTVGKWVEESLWDEVFLDKIRDFLRDTGYHGNISLEGFWDGKEFRAIDPCARLPFPNSAIFPKFIKNYPEVVRKVASGEDVKNIVDKKYHCQVGVYSDVIDIWRKLKIDDKYKDFVGFRRAVKVNDEIWIVPGDGMIATALGEGDTYEEAISNAMETAKHVSGYSLYYIVHLDLDFKEKIEKLNELGGGF